MSIRETPALFDFYTGTLHVNVIVDVGAMSRKFASLGFRVAFEEAENIALTITDTDPAKPDRSPLRTQRPATWGRPEKRKRFRYAGFGTLCKPLHCPHFHPSGMT